jgi:hypothetical protein
MDTVITTVVDAIDSSVSWFLALSTDQQWLYSIVAGIVFIVLTAVVLGRKK